MTTTTVGRSYDGLTPVRFDGPSGMTNKPCYECHRPVAVAVEWDNHPQTKGTSPICKPCEQVWRMRQPWRTAL